MNRRRGLIRSFGLAAVACLLLGNAVAEASLDQTFDRFVSVCAKGGGRFLRGSINPIPYAKLPEPVRNHYGNVPDGKFFELKDAYGSYLIDFTPQVVRGDEYLHVCALLVPGLDIRKGAKIGLSKLRLPTPARFPVTLRQLLFDDPQNGYLVFFKDVRQRLSNGAWLKGHELFLMQISPTRAVQPLDNSEPSAPPSPPRQ